MSNSAIVAAPEVNRGDWYGNVSAGRTVARMTTSERVLLCLTFVLPITTWIAISFYQPLGFDESLSLWTDRVSTVKQLVFVQTHVPISLDPLVYHLMSHWSMTLFGTYPTALRVPAMLGFLLMQVALFLLVSRLAGMRAGILAALLPCLASMSTYAYAGRPYALLFGLHAAALLAWYVVKTASSRARSYVAAVALGLVLILGVHTHFFGVFILLPVTCAELADVLIRKRVDGIAALALVAGYASLLGLLPFVHAVAPYRHAYYVQFRSWSVLLDAYRYLAFGGDESPIINLGNHPSGVLFVLLFAVIAAVAFYDRRIAERTHTSPLGIWVGIVALAAVPLFGIVLVRYAIHAIELRHVSAAFAALPILVAIPLARLLKGRIFTAFVLACVVCVVVQGVIRCRDAKATRAYMLQALQRSTFTEEALAKRPGVPIFIQDVDVFLLESYYETNADYRSRFVFVYDRDMEFHWQWKTTMGITGENLRRFSSLKAVSFAELVASHDPIIVMTQNWSSWLPNQVKQDGDTLLPLGGGFGGGVYVLKVPGSEGAPVSNGSAHP